jgi:hypothetical protein
MAGAVAMPLHDEPSGAVAVYTVLMTAITIGVLAYWLLSANERRRGPLLPLLLLGGFLSAVMEPVLDNLILYWYPPHNSLQAFDAWGRSIPWFVPIGYAWYCGALPYVAFRIFERGTSTRRIWQLLGAVVLVDALAISTAGWLGTSGFYGNQPFNPWGTYPLWWPAVDGPHVMVGGAILCLLVPRLRGRSRAVLVAVPTLTLALVTGLCTWPIALALNSGWSDVPTHIAGAVTLVIGGALVWATTRIVAVGHGRTPFTRWAGSGSVGAGSVLSGTVNSPQPTTTRS